MFNKSLVELRGIAQAFDIPDIFQKDKIQLVQAIEMKQQGLAPAPKIEIPKPEYDARLMTKPPSKKCNVAEVEQLLLPYTSIGLRFTVDENEETWKMAYGKRTDQGTMRMPLRVLLACAKDIMK